VPDSFKGRLPEIASLTIIEAQKQI